MELFANFVIKKFYHIPQFFTSAYSFPFMSPHPNPLSKYFAKKHFWQSINFMNPKS